MDHHISIEEPDSAVSGSVSEIAQKIREAIWLRRPILGEIMKKHGDQTLYEYSRDFIDLNKSPLLDARKGELVSTVQELLTKRLNAEVAEEVAAQLTALPLVSTADHHAFIQHPFWVNANIISALPYLEAQNPLLKYLVVFSFASISLNNASGFSRGLLFHKDDTGEGQLLKVPILPDKEKMAVVHATRSYTADEIAKTKAAILKKANDGHITSDRAEKLNTVVDQYFATEDVLNAGDLSTQKTKINYNLWADIFHGANARTNTGIAMPDLIYLEIETLVTELLLKFHLDNPNSLIYKILFDEKYQSDVKKYFNNIPGAFSFENDWGTYLFWAIDDKHHRVRMFLTEGVLHSTYRLHTYEMTPEGLREALLKKEIFPSMLLSYLIVSLYYGMKCLGGFCQVNDLTMTKAAWQEFLRAHEFHDEAAAVEPVQTKELGGDGMVLSYLYDKNGDITPASGIDMIIEQAATTFDNYLQMAKRVTLNEIMSPMLPEMYTVLYADYERDPVLSALTPEAITKEIKLKDKVLVPVLTPIL